MLPLDETVMENFYVTLPECVHNMHFKAICNCIHKPTHRDPLAIKSLPWLTRLGSSLLAVANYNSDY